MLILGEHVYVRANVVSRVIPAVGSGVGEVDNGLARSQIGRVPDLGCVRSHELLHKNSIGPGIVAEISISHTEIKSGRSSCGHNERVSVTTLVSRCVRRGYCHTSIGIINNEGVGVELGL